jgi:hypothetical protein
MFGGGVGYDELGGGGGSGISGGGAGGGSASAGMLRRGVMCFGRVGACASGFSKPTLGLCGMLSSRFVGEGEVLEALLPVPGTNDGVEEMARTGRTEVENGAGLGRACTDVGRRGDGSG